MLWKIFRKIAPSLIKIYFRISQPRPPNLRGDRDIEYSWILANLPQGPGMALDFGCGTSYLALIVARRGFKTTAIDLTPISWFYLHPNLNFIQKDIFDLEFSPNSLDLVINCSSIEHVGLVNRYGIKKNRPERDLDAMKYLHFLMKPRGTMLLTIPVGKDAVFPPLYRVYGKERLSKLLNLFDVEKKEYWIKNKSNQWALTDEKTALNEQPRELYYALGCFVLHPR